VGGEYQWCLGVSTYNTHKQQGEHANGTARQHADQNQLKGRKENINPEKPAFSARERIVGTDPQRSHKEKMRRRVGERPPLSQRGGEHPTASIIQTIFPPSGRRRSRAPAGALVRMPAGKLTDTYAGSGRSRRLTKTRWSGPFPPTYTKRVASTETKNLLPRASTMGEGAATHLVYSS
jgi:hypothetical protein